MKGPKELVPWYQSNISISMLTDRFCSFSNEIAEFKEIFLHIYGKAINFSKSAT